MKPTSKIVHDSTIEELLEEHETLAAEASTGSHTGRVLAGRYELTRMLGEGATGVVYAARRSRATQEDYAVKIIDLWSSSQGTKVARERVTREIMSLVRLRSPHVVRFEDFFELDGPYVALVTELIHGVTLSDVIQLGTMDPRIALELGLQIASGLADAHANGIVHRDVKPSNVMISHEGGAPFARLIDFGVSALTDRTRCTTGFMGTPLYASPEQFGDGPVDHRADIFSLGTVLFTMLAGRPPFYSENIIKLARMMLTQEPPRLRDVVGEHIPIALDALLRRMLAKDRAQRPGSVVAVMWELERILRYDLASPRPLELEKPRWYQFRCHTCDEIHGCVTETITPDCVEGAGSQRED